MTPPMTHSEPARKAVTVPAGWKLVPVEPTRAMKDAVSRRVDDFAREHARLFVSEIWQDMLSASPAATSAPTYVVNCCNCGRIIDTREESEGGDQWGHELSDDRWVCSPECLDAVTDPDATSAATRGEPVAWFCGGCGETDPSKRCLGCLHGLDHPAPAESAQVKDGRPDGWTEALAISFIAANGHGSEIGAFARAFNEGAWQEIADEWPEFVAFADTRIRASLATDAEG